MDAKPTPQDQQKARDLARTIVQRYLCAEAHSEYHSLVDAIAGELRDGATCRHACGEGAGMTDEEIKYMRDRFLMWAFPETIRPDGGFSFNRSTWLDDNGMRHNHPMPVGTNLLDACEAETMVRYMVQGLPLEPNDPITVLKQQSAEGMPGPSVKIPMPKRDKG